MYIIYGWDFPQSQPPEPQHIRKDYTALKLLWKLINGRYSFEQTSIIHLSSIDKNDSINQIYQTVF